MPRAKPKKRSSSTVRAAVNLVLLVLLLAKLAMASFVNAQTVTPPPIKIEPKEPPGIGQMVQTLLGWLYWGAWVVVFGVGIYGAIQWMMGDSEKGKKYLGGAIIGAIILAALTVLIPALVGG